MQMQLKDECIKTLRAYMFYKIFRKTIQQCLYAAISMLSEAKIPLQQIVTLFNCSKWSLFISVCSVTHQILAITLAIQ